MFNVHCTLTRIRPLPSHTTSSPSHTPSPLPLHMPSSPSSYAPPHRPTHSAANAVSNHQNMKSRHHSIRHMVARLRHQQQTDHDTPTEETNGRTNGGATTEMINRSAHADAQRELTAATAGGGAAAGTTAAGASASNTTSQKQPVRTDQHIPDDPDSAVDIEKGLGGGHTGQSTSAGPSGDAVEESPPSAFAMAFMRPGNEDPANGKTGNGKAQEGKTVSQEKTSFSNGKSLESKGSAAGARGLPKRSSGMALRRQDTLPAQLRVNNGLARKSMLQRCGGGDLWCCGSGGGVWCPGGLVDGMFGLLCACMAVSPTIGALSCIMTILTPKSHTHQNHTHTPKSHTHTPKSQTSKSHTRFPPLSHTQQGKFSGYQAPSAGH